jgi:hypothetical protein
MELSQHLVQIGALLLAISATNALVNEGAAKAAFMINY